MSERSQPLPSAADSKLALDLGELERRREEAAPDRHSIARDFPELTIVDNPDGTWEANGPMTPERRARLDALFSGARAVEEEKAEVLSAATPAATLYGSRGEAVVLPERHSEDAAHRRGLHATRRTIFCGGWLPNARDIEREAAGE